MDSQFSSFDASDLGFQLAQSDMYFGAADVYSSKPAQQQQQACMSVLSSFPIIQESPKHQSHNDSQRLPHTTLGPVSDSLLAHKRQQKTSELKFKIESIGIHPEEDDDLDMCPARTRPGWPQTISPWWKPSHAQEKPPYSYATLIAHAILASKDGRLLLSDIYRWISETYPYYTLDVRNWQNSIRHNLSLNKKWFLKVDRRPTQANPGKGCYWTLVPGTEQVFLENLTQAGGHSRKHHDIGLTTELSLSRRDNCFYASPAPLASTTSSNVAVTTTTTSYTSTTFSHANMRITRPEDYENNGKKKSTSQRPRPTAVAAFHKTDSTSSSVPRLSPMYATFRMTNATPESMSSSKKLKRRRRKHRRVVEPGSYCDDDEDSGCDSGVDLSNEDVAQKRQKKMAESALPSVSPSDLLDNSWTSGFLDAAALGELSAADGLMPLTATGFDPILGLPDDSFFSHNGFYTDDGNMAWPLQDDSSPEMWMDTLVSGTSSSYPSLLTSKYEPLSMEQDQALALQPSKLDDCLMEVLRFQQQLDHGATEEVKMQMPVTVDLSDDEVTATYLHFDESDDVNSDFMKQSFEYASMRDFLYSTCTTSY